MDLCAPRAQHPAKKNEDTHQRESTGTGNCSGLAPTQLSGRPSGLCGSIKGGAVRLAHHSHRILLFLCKYPKVYLLGFGLVGYWSPWQVTPAVLRAWRLLGADVILTNYLIENKARYERFSTCCVLLSLFSLRESRVNLPGTETPFGLELHHGVLRNSHSLLYCSHSVWGDLSQSSRKPEHQVLEDFSGHRKMGETERKHKERETTKFSSSRVWFILSRFCECSHSWSIPVTLCLEKDFLVRYSSLGNCQNWEISYCEFKKSNSPRAKWSQQ